MPLPPVLFEDDAVIAFDKPGNLLPAPDRRDKSQENLLDLVRAKLGAGVATVHRLDADTSGLVLFAKTKPALDFLSGQFQSKTVLKIYQALTVGLPAPTIRAPIALRKSARSTTSGSQAALWITVTPSASVAAIITLAVPRTVGPARPPRNISAPTNRRARAQT